MRRIILIYIPVGSPVNHAGGLIHFKWTRLRRRSYKHTYKQRVNRLVKFTRNRIISSHPSECVNVLLWWHLGNFQTSCVTETTHKCKILSKVQNAAICFRFSEQFRRINITAQDKYCYKKQRRKIYCIFSVLNKRDTLFRWHAKRLVV